MKKKVFFLFFETVLPAFSVQGDGVGRSYTNPANWDNSKHLSTLLDNVSIYKPYDNSDGGPVVDTQTAVGMTVRVGGEGYRTRKV